MTNTKTTLIRLNKFISESGVASRRKADQLISEGFVKVNGKVVSELGTRIDEKTDRIKVRGKLITQPLKKSYFVFNKPKNVVSTLSDPEGRPCIADYFRGHKERLFPVGRLDWDSEGMLLITNDGDFANEVTHPKKKIPKTYIVKINGTISDMHMDKLRKGVSIIGGKAHAISVSKIQRGSEQYDWVKITITEGRNRQVRKMFEKIGFDVKKLQRVSIGHLRIGKLKKGDYKPLNSNQLSQIFKPFKTSLSTEKPRGSTKKTRLTKGVKNKT